MSDGQGTLRRSMHGFALPDKELLKDCDVAFFRSGGPGGQKRNKTSSAVRLTHRPTGLAAVATESRSQSENRRRALKRLRLALALHTRAPIDLADYRRPAFLKQCTDAAGRIHASPRSEHYLPLIQHLLSLLQACDGQVSTAAKHLGVSTSQFSRLLTADEHVHAEANRIRQASGLGNLTTGK